MNIITRIAAIAALTTITIGTLAPAANAADPVPVITCDTLTVTVGTSLHCTVTGTDGLTPTDRITGRTRGGKTNNVNNLAGQTFDITYPVTAADRNYVYETVSATIYIQEPGHLARPIVASATFTVVAA